MYSFLFTLASVDISIARTAAPPSGASIDQAYCTPTPFCASFMPCREPFSHPTVRAVSSQEIATALMADVGFFSLGHLWKTGPKIL